jgi:hypothetical protein
VTVRCWAVGPQGSNNGEFRMAQMVPSSSSGNVGGGGGGSFNSSIDGPVPTGYAVDYSIAQGLCVQNVQPHPRNE